MCLFPQIHVGGDGLACAAEPALPATHGSVPARVWQSAGLSFNTAPPAFGSSAARFFDAEKTML